MPYYKKGKINDRSYDDTKIWNDINLIDEKKTKVEKEVIYTDVEGTNVSADSVESYVEDIEILGNTVQDASNLADIRSVGDKVEGQELYKIDVVSCGKNLLYCGLEIGSIASNGILESNNAARMRTKEYIQIKNTSNYVLSGHDCATYWVFYDINYTFISRVYRTPYYITNDLIPNNAHFLKLVFVDKADTSIEAQLEEGTQATEYEPYIEDKLTILSPVQLEKVGDVADRIICKDGVWGVEKNIETYKFNEVPTAYSFIFNESWAQGNTCGFYTYYFRDNYPTIKYGNGYAICDKLPFSSKNIDKLDEVCIGTGVQYVAFRVPTNEMTSFDKVGAEEWIAKNTPTIKYVRETPQFIPLAHDQQIKLRTFASKTNISFLTEIEGTIKAQVPKSLGATVNTHTEQIGNLNKELDRVKKLEESTVSTVTTESDFTTVEETSNGYFEDVKLEGKTLVNLMDGTKTYFNGTEIIVVNYKNSMLKPNTEYTVYLIDQNPNFKTDAFFASSNMTLSTGRDITKPIKLVTNDTINTYKGFYYYLKPEFAGDSSSVPSNLRVVLLEGDHTQNPPSYFEGLKSVGDGVDEVSVESVNENLFDINEKDYNSNNVQLTISGNNLLLTPTQALEWLSCSIKVRGLRNGETYNINCDCANYHLAPSLIAIYENSTNREIGNWSQNYFTIPIDTNVNDLYLRVHCSDGNVNNSKEVNVSNIQIRKGQQKLPYIPHQSDKKSLLYYNPTTETWEKPVLRQWDSIEKHSDGKYYYHKRSGEVVLDGSDGDWTINITSENNIEFTTRYSVLNGNTEVILSDKFINLKVGDTERIALLANGQMYITISKSRLSTQDVAGFKQWLQTNPTTVVYQLAQEEVYECTNIDLITYANETNFIINCGAIVPKTTLKVHNNIANVILLLQKEVSLLESESDKIFKDILSGDYRSLAYGLYPEDFDTED